MQPRFSRWMGRNPLALLALVAVAAIVLADSTELRASNGLAAATIGILGVTWWRPRAWLLLIAVAMVFACCHAMRLDETRGHPLRQQLLAMGDQPVPVVLRGHLIPFTNGSVLDARRAVCETQSIQWPGGGTELLQARIKLSLPPNFELDKPGVYEMHGHILLPAPPMNPGQFNAAEYAWRMGWVAEGRIAKIQRVQEAAWAPRFHLLLAAEACRQWISRQLSRDLEDDPETAAVIMAMALGASDAAEDEIEDAFRDSGTLHVFAVSGLHVGMVAGVGWMLLSLLTVRRSLAMIVLIAIVFGYAFVTGWRPSAARAAFMIAIFFGASLIQRQSSLQNSLGAAALVLLAADTHQLFQPGFQLSFGVLWAIALGVTPLMALAHPWCQLDPFLPHPLVHSRQRAWAGLRVWSASVVSVSIAAWIGGLPLMLGHFHSVTPVALIANCFLVPLSFLCIGTTCLSLGFAGIGFAGAQVLLNNTNWLLAKAMVAMAVFFADAPMANFSINPQPQRSTPEVEIRVMHLPGGGAASHLRAGTAHWLIDTADAKGWRSVVAPWLRKSGVNHLHGIILTHGDVDHAGAAAIAARKFSPAWLCTSQHEPWRLDPSFATLRQLHAQAEQLHWNWRRLGVDERIGFAESDAVTAEATVLYPSAHDHYDKADDRGLVLMLAVNGLRVLWLGDAGFITEKALLEREVPLTCDILVRSQHAADYSGLTEFLLAAQPQAIISTSDRRRLEQAMPQRIRDYCASHAAALYDLQACGSVGITFDHGTARLHGFRNGQTTAIRAHDSHSATASE